MDKDTTYDYSVLDVTYNSSQQKCNVSAHEIYQHLASHREVRLHYSGRIYRAAAYDEYYDNETFEYNDCYLKFIYVDEGQRIYFIECDYSSPAPQSTQTPDVRTWYETWGENWMVYAPSTSKYSTCSTAGSTAAKTISINGYTLQNGDIIAVKFDNTNTAANATLSISSGAARTIQYMGSALTSSNAGLLASGSIVTFQFNGVYMNIINVYPESSAIPLATVESWFE